MKFKRLLQATALAAAGLLLGAADTQNWNTVVAETDGGHRIGKPDAKVRITEYISYTCPHCARFAQEGEQPIKLVYVTPGQASIEIRHLIRDNVDFTAAMLANCGPAAKFPLNHSAFMLGQARWIGPLTSATAAQQARWRVAGAAGRKAVASDFKFYQLMEGRGYTRIEVDKCLSDATMAKKIAENSDKDWKRPGIDSTPSFAINGIVMPGTHTWPDLERQLKAFL